MSFSFSTKPSHPSMVRGNVCSRTRCPLVEGEQGLPEGLCDPAVPYCFHAGQTKNIDLSHGRNCTFSNFFSQVQATPIWKRKHLPTACSKGEGLTASHFNFQPPGGDSSHWSSLISGHQGIDKHGADCRN